MTNPTDYFDRFLALQQMILEASEDLKQLRADAIEELITEATPKDKAKEIRADLAEVIACAKIKAKGDLEERKQAEKMARRRRVAEECGVQLDLLGGPAMPSGNKPSGFSPRVRMMARAADEAGVSPEVKDLAMRTARLSETNPAAAAAVVATVKALATEGADAFREPADMHAGG
jgi:hypothetical protein